MQKPGKTKKQMGGQGLSVTVAAAGSGVFKFLGRGQFAYAVPRPLRAFGDLFFPGFPETVLLILILMVLE